MWVHTGTMNWSYLIKEDTYKYTHTNQSVSIPGTYITYPVLLHPQQPLPHIVLQYVRQVPPVLLELHLHLECKHIHRRLHQLSTERAFCSHSIQISLRVVAVTGSAEGERIPGDGVDQVIHGAAGWDHGLRDGLEASAHIMPAVAARYTARGSGVLANYQGLRG